VVGLIAAFGHHADKKAEKQAIPQPAAAIAASNKLAAICTAGSEKTAVLLFL
jgi:hypothetical protein